MKIKIKSCIYQIIFLMEKSLRFVIIRKARVLEYKISTYSSAEMSINLLLRKNPLCLSSTTLVANFHAQLGGLLCRLQKVSGFHKIVLTMPFPSFSFSHNSSIKTDKQLRWDFQRDLPSVHITEHQGCPQREHLWKLSNPGPIKGSA